MIRIKQYYLIWLALPIFMGIFLISYYIIMSANKSPPTPNYSFPPFSCRYEKDSNPPITEKAEQYFKRALALDKDSYLPVEQLRAIEKNYQKAVALGHWKAMNNLAALYLNAKYSQDDLHNGNALNRNPTGIKIDLNAALVLYAKMVALRVPQGYYNWHLAIVNGWIAKPTTYNNRFILTEAARLGSPLAQVKLGNYFSFSLPKEHQRDDIAEQYFNCAGAQDNPQALMEVAAFYKIAKKNMPKALYYYQKAASLGSEDGFAYLREAFSDDATGIYELGYLPNPTLFKQYTELYYELRENAELRFPRLMQDYPLPRHPSQGYDADNPDVRPDN